MPPLPMNGTSYPPSSSGYQPLNHDDDDEETSFPTSSAHSSRIRTRTFGTSPYNSQANSPTDLLRCFLSDTRTSSTKQLSLRIRFSSPQGGSDSVVEVPLPNLSNADSLPFAVADDLPALRGLPRQGKPNFKARLKAFADEITGRTPTQHHSLPSQRDKLDSGEGLQVFNRAQGKSLYATDEEIQRYRQRLETGTLPPWAPLNEEFVGASSQQPNESADDGEDREADGDAMDLDFSNILTGQGDLDLSIFFTRSRKRQSTRLISTGLQEAIERFADDRHFSKFLICREEVWGWDMVRLKRELAKLASEHDGGKGKGKAASNQDGEVEVEMQVVGLESGPVYHVVWLPIRICMKRMLKMFESRAALIAVTSVAVIFVASTLLGILTNAMFILLGLGSTVAWTAAMWLVRTRTRCVYDTIGTAWTLAPRWVRLADVDSSWDHARVVASLISDGGGDPRVEKRGEQGWFVRRGLDQGEWLELHRQRILHTLTRNQS